MIQTIQSNIEPNYRLGAESFCYWLQGHFEMNPNNNALTEEQVKMIREHLKLVFTHIVNSPTIIFENISNSTNYCPKPYIGPSAENPTSYPYPTTICSAAGRSGKDLLTGGVSY